MGIIVDLYQPVLVRQIRALSFLVLLIFTLNLTSSFAQPEKVNFRNIGPHEGLPTTSVTDITQDALGFIWIGTWDWAYRYDGRNFRKFPVSGGRYLEADQNGGIWITAESGAVWHYDAATDSLKRYKVESGWRFNMIIEDDSGMIWTPSKIGLMRLNPTSGKFELDPGQQKGSVVMLEQRAGNLYFIYLDSDSRLHLGTRNSFGEYLYVPFPDRSESLVANSLGEHQVNPIHLIALDTGAMVITNHGWAIGGNQSKRWSFGKPQNPQALNGMQHAILDDNSYLWVHQISSISRIDIITGESIVYEVDDPSKGISSGQNSMESNIFIDRQGILWAARFATGMSRLNLFDNDFGLAVNEEGLPYKDILSVYEMEDGSYFLGSRSFDGLLYFDRDNHLIKRFTTDSFFKCPPGRSVGTELGHPFVWWINKTEDGSIWVATGWPRESEGGISRIMPDRKSIVRFRHDPTDSTSIPGNWIRKLLIDGSGRIWASMMGGGLFVIDPITEEVNRTPFSGNNELTGTQSSAMMVTSEGDIIIAQKTQTYLVDHETLEVDSFGFKTANRQIANFHFEDNSGVFWFTLHKSHYFQSIGKFGAWNPETGEKIDYSESELFSEFEVSAIIGSKEGDIWLGTDKGIVRFTPKDQVTQTYGIERGLQGNLFSEYPSYRGPSGKIYLGGNGGINIFHPDDIIENPYPPDMVITDIKLDGQTITHSTESMMDAPITMAQKFTVTPEVTVISIDFAALHFASDGENSSEYFLEGFDKGWRDGGTVGNATYTNLPHGNYVFRIRGSNWDGVWSDGSKSIEIIVLPPWYLTWWAYLIYGLVLAAGVFGVSRYQRKRVIQKERERAKDRELAQAREIEKAYTELKSTQTQLIHSEKMASLGELTAGIAHEIQNPLNFVNNFSEVNKELVDELEEEIEKGNNEEAKTIIKDIRDNEEKVTYHGKRAEAIVKSMLQHSRTSTGKKEPTDINSLADEYLRLAYHGFRAKDKSFNASFKTELADNLPKIHVVPQDIGRVLLNLINNAFQAVRGVKNPEVTVKTQMEDGTVAISVIDNGHGIPADIREKIFQPFFTTKAAGEGTGLGLSLSYDIVTKGHSGQLMVGNKEGEGLPAGQAGSIFTIILPKT